MPDFSKSGPPTSTIPARQRGETLWALFVAAAVFVAYLPALQAGFVWDDFPALHDNVFLRSWSGLSRIWTTHGQIPNESHYWPVLYSLYWIQYQLWELNPLGYHLTNMVLHVGSALLLARILKRFAVPGAWLAVVLFALHPVQVESVAWIHSCKNVLSACLGFLAVTIVIGERAEDPGWKRWLRVAGGAGLMTAAMLSKTSALVIPFGLGLLLWWKSGGLRALLSPGWVALAAVAVLFTLLDITLAKGVDDTNLGLSLGERFLLILDNTWFYIEKLILPVDLVTLYPKRPILAFSLADAARLVGLSILAGTFAWLALKRGMRGPAAALLWFAGAHAPTIGILDFGFLEKAYTADRYQYLPAIGAFALIGAGILQLQNRLGPRDAWLCPIAAAVLALMMATTWNQSSKYENVETLFRHNLPHNPNSPIVHNQIGTALAERGELEEAERHLRESLRLEPRNPEAWNNLGMIHERRGEYAETVAAYRRSIEAGAPWAALRNDLAWHLATAPDPEVRNGLEAVRWAEEANRLTDGEVPGILDTLAAAYAEAGDFDKAVETAERAIEKARARRETALLPIIENHLKAYRAGMPWRAR